MVKSKGNTGIYAWQIKHNSVVRLEYKVQLFVNISFSS